MPIYNNSAELIGNTPLVRLQNLARGAHAEVLVKLESFNPLSSVKDRVALSMIERAEKDGLLTPGGVIVEPTSGNTGIGLAFVAATRGYSVILTMPETMSVERRTILSALGAKLVLTDGAKGMAGAIEKANEIAKELDGAFMPCQFENPANPEAHRRTTAEEIWRDTEGRVDVFVAGIGTGGTITGVGEALKKRNANVKIIGVEPDASAALSGGKAGAHAIQGIGAGFVPSILNRALLDELVRVTDADAIQTARRLAKEEGILAGVSSGAALWAALRVAERKESAGKRIVTLLPDTGERYLSGALFSEDDAKKERV